MKNLQTRFLKFSLFATFFFVAYSMQAKSYALTKADSLFKLKLYTQSFEIYNIVYQSGQYTPAMLLKMAYIQEGLGHIGQSIYYLRLYQHATDDVQVYDKMQELAGKYNLSGYEQNDVSRVYRWINKNLLLLESSAAALLVFLTFSIFFLRQKNKPYRTIAMVTFLLSIGIVYLNNFISLPSVITNGNRIYLMEGPSSGSSVAGILGDGNQLQVVGHEDVWLKVKWNDKKVFVKESNVLHVSL